MLRKDMKKFICRIYFCRPFEGSLFRYEEKLSDVRLVEASKFEDFALSEVHTYFVNCVRDHRNKYPHGRYRVTTSMTRSNVVESSYILV